MKDFYEIDLLEKIFGEKILEFNIYEIPHGNSGTLTARITGKLKKEEFSVVVKSRRNSPMHRALWYVQDQRIMDREYHVYELLERLKVPHARVLARRYKAANDWALVLEDLIKEYTLPDANYNFSEYDQNIIIETYAAIHSASLSISLQKMGGTVKYLQPEESSQVNETTAEQMLETFHRFLSGTYQLSTLRFKESVSILLDCRKLWHNAPRSLVYNDFYPTNIALPKTIEGHAILFDWELAGIGLPQFDLINLCYDRSEFNLNRVMKQYIGRVKEKGLQINIDEFKAGMEYSNLCSNFYALWLLHLKLQADPTGKLPKWMSSQAEKLFSGELIRSAQKAVSHI